MDKKLVDIKAKICHETDYAYLLFDGRMEIKSGDVHKSEVRVWVPKSEVEYNDDDNSFTMPEWLALEKGFI